MKKFLAVCSLVAALFLMAGCAIFEPPPVSDDGNVSTSAPADAH